VFFRRADRDHFEAGRAEDSGGRADSAGRGCRTDLYRWKKKYTGLQIDQVRQLKQMAEENTRLKRIVADLTLDKAMLQDVLRNKF
jgi:hypothetical protein